MLVAPSILSANFNNLYEEVKKVETADYLHIDVMDGHFVPNISFGTCVYDNLKGKTNLPFDVHLMITNPLFYAESFAKKADILTFHYESNDDVLKTINKIKSLNTKVGISIKPKTDPKVLIPYLYNIDLVLVMSVEPGFGGQKFMEDSLEKIAFLNKYRQENHLNYLIEVDGGINLENAKKCADKGCDICVAGTYIFKANDILNTINELKQIKISK